MIVLVSLLRRAAAPLAALVLCAALVHGQTGDGHWAFRPPQRPEVPVVDGVEHPVDAFVQRRLAAEGVPAAPRADEATLVRRLSLDLTGLPATWEDLAFHRAQPREVAWRRLVDRYLRSPAHAERMAAIWLDLARYADSKGYGSDPLRSIWRYRDWVIQAYERNLPFDEFTVLQLAGDLLPDATWRETLPTAFHRNTKTNTEGGTDDEEFRVEAVRDRVDTTLSVWMGLTAGCAKCHDHKFDPLTQREYYALFDFFNHTADTDRNDDAPRIETPTAAQQAALAELDARREALQQELAERRAQLGDAPQRWAAARRAQQAEWRVLRPGVARTESAAELVIGDDGFVTARGPVAARDRYELEFGRLRGPLQTLRLELAPGAERSTLGRPPGNGNAVLSELRVGLRGAAAPRGRFVRVELPGRGRILSLAEVEVCDRDGVNRARGRDARQSSEAFAGAAARAVDGDTGGAYRDGSVTHTRTGTDPWWEVDLGTSCEIASVRLWNRTDGDLEQRLRGAVLSVLDAERRTVWSSVLPEVPEPSCALRLAEVVQWRRPVAAAASFAQDGWPAARAVDGDSETGWALAPRYDRPQVATWRFAPPLHLQAGETLVVQLDQRYGAHHVLGRFRLAAHAADLPALPAAVAAAVSTAAERRDAAQREALADHHAAIDPSLAAVRAALDDLAAERAALDVARTPVLQELPPDRRRTSHVLQRGNFLARGAQVTAATPAAFHPFPDDAPRNRLGLARWLVDRRNPLTARVQVNRLWARLFGVGLVETEEDFGTQGSPPSHPELLDWLAMEFMDSGWDVRHLLRTIVTSAAYRRAAAAPSPAVRAADPHNRLLARGPRFRLEAEMVRDQALAVAGLLSTKRYGPSVFPPQPEGLWRAAFNGNDRTWDTSEGADRYRRAIYTFMRRSSPYPALTTFDAPTRELCTLRRIRTNTPLQAFVTLNDPAFVECAQALARRIVAEGGTTPLARARWALRELLLREDVDAEAEVLVELYVRERAHHLARPAAARRLATDPLGPLPPDADAAELAAWTSVANALLNADAVLTRP